MKINYKSDFDFILDLKDPATGESVGIPSCGWEAVFTSGRTPGNKYVASQFRGVKKNWFEDEGRIHVVFDNHNLGIGELKCEFRMYVPDAAYPDGYRKAIVSIPTGVTLDAMGDNDQTAGGVIFVPSQAPASDYSLYEDAVAHGYTGTEEEWWTAMNMIPGLETQVTRLEDNIDRILEALNDNAEVAALTAENEALTASNAELTTQNETLTAENETLGTQVASLQSDNDTLTTQNESLTTQNETLTAENASLATAVYDIDSVIPTSDGGPDNATTMYVNYSDGLVESRSEEVTFTSANGFNTSLKLVAWVDNNVLWIRPAYDQNCNITGSIGSYKFEGSCVDFWNAIDNNNSLAIAKAHLDPTFQNKWLVKLDETGEPVTWPTINKTMMHDGVEFVARGVYVDNFAPDELTCVAAFFKLDETDVAVAHLWVRRHVEYRGAETVKLAVSALVETKSTLADRVANLQQQYDSAMALVVELQNAGMLTQAQRDAAIDIIMAAGKWPQTGGMTEYEMVDALIEITQGFNSQIASVRAELDSANTIITNVNEKLDQICFSDSPYDTTDVHADKVVNTFLQLTSYYNNALATIEELQNAGTGFTDEQKQTMTDALTAAGLEAPADAESLFNAYAAYASDLKARLDNIAASLTAEQKQEVIDALNSDGRWPGYTECVFECLSDPVYGTGDWEVNADYTYNGWHREVTYSLDGLQIDVWNPDLNIGEWSDVQIGAGEPNTYIELYLHLSHTAMTVPANVDWYRKDGEDFNRVRLLVNYPGMMQEFAQNAGEAAMPYISCGFDGSQGYTLYVYGANNSAEINGFDTKWPVGYAYTTTDVEPTWEDVWNAFIGMITDQHYYYIEAAADRDNYLSLYINEVTRSNAVQTYATTELNEAGRMPQGELSGWMFTGFDPAEAEMQGPDYNVDGWYRSVEYGADTITVELWNPDFSANFGPITSIAAPNDITLCYHNVECFDERLDVNWTNIYQNEGEDFQRVQVQWSCTNLGQNWAQAAAQNFGPSLMLACTIKGTITITGTGDGGTVTIPGYDLKWPAFVRYDVTYADPTWEQIWDSFKYWYVDRKVTVYNLQENYNTASNRVAELEARVSDLESTASGPTGEHWDKLRAALAADPEAVWPMGEDSWSYEFNGTSYADSETRTFSLDFPEGVAGIEEYGDPFTQMDFNVSVALGHSYGMPRVRVEPVTQADIVSVFFITRNSEGAWSAEENQIQGELDADGYWCAGGDSDYIDSLVASHTADGNLTVELMLIFMHCDYAALYAFPFTWHVAPGSVQVGEGIVPQNSAEMFNERTKKLAVYAPKVETYDAWKVILCADEHNGTTEGLELKSATLDREYNGVHYQYDCAKLRDNGVMDVYMYITGEGVTAENAMDAIISGLSPSISNAWVSNSSGEQLWQAFDCGFNEETGEETYTNSDTGESHGIYGMRWSVAEAGVNYYRVTPTADGVEYLKPLEWVKTHYPDDWAGLLDPSCETPVTVNFNMFSKDLRFTLKMVKNPDPDLTAILEAYHNQVSDLIAALEAAEQRVAELEGGSAE